MTFICGYGNFRGRVEYSDAPKNGKSLGVGVKLVEKTSVRAGMNVF